MLLNSVPLSDSILRCFRFDVGRISENSCGIVFQRYGPQVFREIIKYDEHIPKSSVI